MITARCYGLRMPARVMLSLMLCSLFACGGHTPAPVEDRYGSPQPKPGSRGQPPAAYLVQRGDTLYSISFHYGLDYRKVAATNYIPAPYTIYPGRYLLLKETAPPPLPVSRPRPIISSGATASLPAATPSVPTNKLPVPKPAPKPVKANPAATEFVGSKVSAWRWPTSGRVTRGYSASVHKGIDISGKRGDPVEAVAAGKVVYAGSGIVGFGALLIIKHNEVYLSAYGHNDRLLVAEGQSIRAGQKIAEKGNSGTDTVKLHFEIRKEGKPIDPKRLLPRR
jgi:lipoprotein NlpD